jgi:predicted negative regulator of RcsB-dependent stress response
MSEILLNETIDTLERRVVAGSFNPSLYRILGDRYIEAWMPQKAKTAYIKALQLARFQKNSSEVELVQQRLSALWYNNYKMINLTTIS